MFLKLNKFFSRLDVKLTAYYTLILLALAFSLCAFFYYRLEHNLEKQVDRILLDESNEFLSEITEDVKKGGTIFHGCEIFEEGISNRKHFPLYFRLLKSSGRIVFQAAHTKVLSFPLPENREGSYEFNPPGSSALFRVYESAIIVEGRGAFIFQIATKMKQTENILGNFLENIFRAIPAILFLSIFCGIYIARKPRMIIRHITSVAKKITYQNMNQRLEVPLAEDEIRDLTLTINEMMDRLERSFKHTRQFTADVSHELRNPLFALKGEIEVILSQKRDVHEYREALYECHERVDYLIKMANDLFMISRFDENKFQMKLDHLDFNEIIQNIYDLFLPMAEEKKIVLAVIPADRVTILGDNIKLSQAVSNLVDNAIKFTPPNGRVELGIAREKDHVVLRVKDNGEGIPEDKLDRIFDRFYQADASRSGHKGTGLGLQICKRIIEAHNGRIKVERNTEKGVTFRVFIPEVKV